MILSWTPKAWEQYLYWQATDKSVLRKLNDLLQECLRHHHAPVKENPKP